MEDLAPGRVRSADTNFNRWTEPLLVGLPNDYGATPLAARFRRLPRRVLEKAQRVLKKAQRVLKSGLPS